MKNKSISTLTKTALLTSIVFISTRIINVPTPIGGVINLSDGVILAIALMTSRSSATLASGLGAFLSEVFSPYAIFAPATLIIKSMMAYTVSTLNEKLHFNKTITVLISFVAAELIMITGYFLYQAFALKLGVYTASLDIVNNVIQAGLSIALALIIYKSFTLRKKSV